MTAIVSDEDLFAILREKLFTAVVGDVLDKLGYRKQFLPHTIGPLRSDMRIIGRAMTVLEADVFDEVAETSRGPLGREPFGLMMEALDDLKPGEVYIATGASLKYALWGELMSTRATHLKAAGAVLNGFVRDANGIEALNFPTFCRGIYAQDQGPRGKVIDFRIPVEIDGIRVNPGDLLFGDREGVLVIPRPIEKEAIEKALEKASTENRVATAIKKGMSAREAFNTFGVL